MFTAGALTSAPGRSSAEPEGAAPAVGYGSSNWELAMASGDPWSIGLRSAVESGSWDCVSRIGLVSIASGE